MGVTVPHRDPRTLQYSIHTILNIARSLRGSTATRHPSRAAVVKSWEIHPLNRDVSICPRTSVMKTGAIRAISTGKWHLDVHGLDFVISSTNSPGAKSSDQRHAGRRSVNVPPDNRRL